MIARTMIPALALAALPALPTRAEPPGPIHVIIDVHADPMGADIEVQREQYADWSDALDWVLEASDPFGARLSFLATGQFMEWVLEDPAEGHPRIARLYESGGLVGTHSHRKRRVDLHVWEEMPPDPPKWMIEEQWADHFGVVDAVIEAALGVEDPDERLAINTARGAHLDDDEMRLRLMGEGGFTIHQQGPERVFARDFAHYIWNAYRPSAANFLAHDPDGPVVLSPFGTALGQVVGPPEDEHDMTLPMVKARFLMELLNWLDDVKVAQSGRVWTAGWGVHAHDLLPDEESTDAWEPMLAWLAEHFIGRPAGGVSAATFSTMIESRDAFEAWELAHPGETPFAYEPDGGDPLDAYPYLVPVQLYLAGTSYEAAEPALGVVRWHRVALPSAPRWIMYTTTGDAVRADVSAHVPPGPLAAVDPGSGRFVVVPPMDVPVGAAGTIVVRAPDAIILDDFADLDESGDVGFGDLVLMLAQWGACPGERWPGGCPADLDGDWIVGFADLLLLLGRWS